jgi:hypothetical protein
MPALKIKNTVLDGVLDDLKRVLRTVYWFLEHPD